MKKTLSLAIVLCLVLALLAGCGAQGGTASSAPAASKSEAPAPATGAPAPAPETDAPAEPEDAPPAEPGYVEIALPLTEEEVTFTYLNAINPQIANYFEKYSDISVYQELGARTGVFFETMDIPMPAMMEQFNVLLAAEDLPDYINNGNDYYSGGAVAAVQDEVFVNIADYLDACPNFAYLLTTDEVIYKTEYCGEGIIGAFYEFLSEPQFENGTVIRADWLAETGLEAPVTYDDWYEVLTALKAKGHEGAYAFQAGDGGDSFVAGGLGVNCYSGRRMAESQFSLIDGVVSFSGAEQNYLDYLTLMNKWYSEGLIYPDSAVLSSRSQTQMIGDKIKQGEVGIATIEQTNISAYEELLGGEAKFTPLVQPTETGAEKVHYSRYGSRVQTSNYCITTNCENPELLIRFIDYMYSEEGSFLCNWGVENEAHTKGPDGLPQWTELVSKNPDGLSVDFAASLYALDMGPFMEDAHRYDSVMSAAEIEAAKVWGSNVDREWMFPSYVTLPAEDSSEVSVLWTDISTYIQENFFKFINGEKPLSDWEDYVAALKGMDIDRCVEIYQAAYDAYIG